MPISRRVALQEYIETFITTIPESRSSRFRAYLYIIMLWVCFVCRSFHCFRKWVLLRCITFQVLSIPFYFFPFLQNTHFHPTAINGYNSVVINFMAPHTRRKTYWIRIKFTEVRYCFVEIEKFVVSILLALIFTR